MDVPDLSNHGQQPDGVQLSAGKPARLMIASSLACPCRRLPWAAVKEPEHSEPVKRLHRNAGGRRHIHQIHVAASPWCYTRLGLVVLRVVRRESELVVEGVDVKERVIDSSASQVRHPARRAHPTRRI